MEFLANVAIRWLALAVLAGAVLFLLRVRSAAARHAVWTLVSAAMLVLMAAQLWLPALPLRLLHATPAPALARFEPMAVAPVDFAPLTLPEVAPAPRISAVPPQPARRPMAWRQVAWAVYFAGVLISLALLAAGFRFTRRMVLTAGKVEAPGFDQVFESSWIAVPVTVGWLRPRILLPVAWRTWPAEKLAAVITHERAHVGRADWAIAVMAAVNRCLFWFHPVAWILERHLSALAEQAADDAALLTLGRRTHYAQTLLDMAAAVRLDGGRRVKAAVAMAKTAEVRQRIERILDDNRQIPQGVTRARWIVLVLAGVPVVYAAAALQLQRQAPAALPVLPPQSALQFAVEPAPPVRAPLPSTVVLLPAVTAAMPEPAPAAPQPPAQPVATFQATTTASSEPPYGVGFDRFRLDIMLNVDPVYPPAALAAGIEGDVALRVVVGTDGRVLSAQPLSGHPLLLEAALKAANLRLYVSRFPPSVEPMQVQGTIIIPFRLPPGVASAAAGEIRQVVWSGTVAPFSTRPGSPVMFAEARVLPASNPAEEERKRLAQGIVVQGLGNSGGFRYPVLLKKYESEYPLPERSAGIQGTVALSATIGADGHPREIQVTKSIDPALDECARAAVAKWLFSPAKQDGAYIDAAANINVNFQLLAPGQPPRVDTLSANFVASGRGVTVYVQVGPDGKISHTAVLRSLGSGFDQKAMEAAETWPFQVVYEKGQPVGYSTVVDVEFQ